jgi:hypothetical protein
MSFVGNVLGLPGEMGGFVDEVQGEWYANAGIWLLGWDAEDPYPYDPQVAATAIRDGNYDYLNNEQRWLTSAPESLPYSFYLADKPAFFGPNPWPWVDPTTGITYTLPAKARFDGGTPNIVP